MRRETRIPGLRRVVRNLSGRVELDADDEIGFHIETRTAELTAKGVPEQIARQIAEAEFGDLPASRNELAAVDRRRHRRERIVRWADATAHELRHAVRSLRRSPAFSIGSVLTFALGLGAVAAMFSVVDGVLLRQLPFGKPERLVAATHDLPPLDMRHLPQTASTYFAYQRLAHTIEGIGVYLEGDANVADPGSAARPERMMTASISATLIPVLDVSPIVGRVFTAAEDLPGGPPVMLIGEGMWRSRFAGDTRTVGRRLEVDGVSREIVGIMPARFRFAVAATEVWIPLQLDPVDPPPTAYAYTGIARLKPGVTVAVAERDFASVLPRLPELYPNFVTGISTKAMMDQMHPRPVLAPLQDDLTVGIAGTLWMVAAAAVLVLLVACANVANLVLVRADARQREFALREAIGAGRGRLLLHFFVESAVIATVSAALGLAAATTAVRALVAAGPRGIPRLTEVRVDGTTVLFTVLAAAAVALGCSLVPAVRIGQAALVLRQGGRGTAGRLQQRVRGGLVAAQVAFALVVLAGSGLLMRTFARLHSIRLGFDAASVATFWTSLPAIRYKSDTAVVQSYARLVDRVRALPGVAAVGLTSRLPLEPHGIDENPLYPEDDASFATKLPPLQLFTAVNGDYFKAMGIPLIAGKTFEPMGAQRDGEAIISRSTALSFWKDSTGIAALGKRFRPLPTGRLYTVVGVVGDTRDTALAAPPSQVVYFPETFEIGGRTARSRRTMALVVRTRGGNGSLLPAVQQAVRELDPTLPIFDVRTMGAVESAATAQLTFIITVLGAAAVITLILGAVGLYSVLAYVVTLRTRELAIRLSLGATPSAVAGSMTRYGVTLAGVGIGAGLALFALVARSLRTMLFGVSAGDPLALGAAALTLVAVALLASWLPARRAARIDPASTLRSN